MVKCNTTDDQATIRVSNLSEDTRESDLQELFSPFGKILRTFLAKDKSTGQSKACVSISCTQAVFPYIIYRHCVIKYIFINFYNNN